MVHVIPHSGPVPATDFWPPGGQRLANGMVAGPLAVAAGHCEPAL